MTRSEPRPATLAELRASGWRSRTVKEELRANLKGVDAAKVKRLRVSLESFCSGKDAC